MNTNKPIALELADRTPSLRGGDWSDKAAAELRRLHEINFNLCRKCNTLTILSSRDEDKITALEAINQELLAALKVAALAIHEYRNLGAPWAYWDDVQYQAYTAINKAEKKEHHG